MASGPISMGDQLIITYNVTLTNYLSDCIAPRYVVINKPGFYTITITGSATGDSGSYWYGMCVIYNDPAGNYYCKALGGLAGAYAPYIHQSNLTNNLISLDTNDRVISNTPDWVNASTDIGGGGFRIGARGTYEGPVTIMIFHIG